jgi:hypothetical protein
MEQQVKVDRERANVMAGRICAAAGLTARSECDLLELIGEFDELGAIRWWTDLKSLAHWLSWCCSLAPGTAREYVRVARAMRRMPTVTAAFRGGRLSYSKVREVTRVVGVLDEERLCQMALTATASQLARMLRAYRSTAGSRIRQERERAMNWTERDDEMIDFRIRLPKEEAAAVIAALTAAKDQFGAPPSGACPDLPATRSGSPADPTPTYGYANAIVDVARVFLDTAPEDRSGEDRTLVVVHVSAEQLARDVPAAAYEDVAGWQDVPAGTYEAIGGQDVPAGTPDLGHADGTPPAERSVVAEFPDATCHIQGVGGIEPETARRLVCDAPLLTAVVDAEGDVLALGRSRRLVSRGQRRALMIRDGMCQFTGCHQERHLEAHHIVPWSQGGPTDMGNLILLCRFHHTCVHEGGMTIVRAAEPSAGRRWVFLMPDGRPHQDWYRAESLANLLPQQTAARQAEWDAVIEGVDGFHHPDALRIVPGWRGERFDIHDCVQALYRMQLSEDGEPEESWQAA